MIGNGGGRRWATAWPDINDQQYRGIIRAILPILEQYYRYWSKKARIISRLCHRAQSILNLPPLSPFLKQVCPILRGLMLLLQSRKIRHWMCPISPVKLIRTICYFVGCWGEGPLLLLHSPWGRVQKNLVSGENILDIG